MSGRLLTVKNILEKNYELLPFEGDLQTAFSQPENKGVWIIWGESGNGKTQFVIDLVKELTRYYRVLFNALEEGDSHTLKLKLMESGLGNNILFGCESMQDISVRLDKKRSPQVLITDSIQYTGMNFKQYKEFKEKHKNKLLIFLSHEEGSLPEGRVAKRVRYDASLKIRVNGFVAFSQGRYTGPAGRYIIWPDGAAQIHGQEILDLNKRILKK